jgi:hypothetical protein
LYTAECGGWREPARVGEGGRALLHPEFAVQLTRLSPPQVARGASALGGEILRFYEASILLTATAKIGQRQQLAPEIFARREA